MFWRGEVVKSPCVCVHRWFRVRLNFRMQTFAQFSSSTCSTTQKNGKFRTTELTYWHRNNVTTCDILFTRRRLHYVKCFARAHINRAMKFVTLFQLRTDFRGFFVLQSHTYWRRVYVSNAMTKVTTLTNRNCTAAVWVIVCLWLLSFQFWFHCALWFDRMLINESTDSHTSMWTSWYCIDVAGRGFYAIFGSEILSNGMHFRCATIFRLIRCN